MLRKIRLSLAILSFAAVTLLFLDFTGTVHAWLGWMAKIQFLPAVLALNVGVVLFLVVLTGVLGRVYCSVICPLGIFQDVVSWISGKRKKKKFRFSYSPAKSWMRYGVLAIFIVAMVAGIGSVVALLAPYSSYGRIAQNLFSPVYIWGNNLLAYFAERADSYMFYEKVVWLRSLPTFIIASCTFVALILLAWRNGRTYCNTICPVGTVLGFIARYSLFRPVIDGSKCKNCSLCARKCKAACIDYKNHRIDYSRCVTCLDCIDTCKHGALHYQMRRGKTDDKKENTPQNESQTDNARRSFLTGIGLLAATSVVKAQEKKVDGGLAVILDKKVPERRTPIVPPGAQGLRHMATHCTGCQLCVSVCPNGVLRPSAKIDTLMQPESSYERGYCRPECTKCSEVCPAGAILRITPADKSAIRIGHAVWVRKNCIPLTDGVECGNCARHCPSGAILMVPSDSEDPNSVKIPVVNTERCIGCGACEHLCPARPFSAIYVEGHTMHSVM
ncbi:4Fe-4S binding protein [Parabacteroides timonensis]|uniref:4Fe-4S binding protein n=1 Tax=Parabacteroides timonensis TaxID=1871013 RepID=UPI00094EB9D8|nr:4Fe-4S binding protein [Parabacteroides timonensis]